MSDEMRAIIGSGFYHERSAIKGGLRVPRKKRATFSERLIFARTKRGKTQKDVADSLNMTVSGYAFYEQ